VTFDGFASPRPSACGCTCHDPGPLAARLRAAANEYVSTLVDGSSFDWAIDGRHLAPFWSYLFPAIREAGFGLSVEMVDGAMVYTVHNEKREASAAAKAPAPPLTVPLCECPACVKRRETMS
jgi:hypothetical protein